MTDVSGTYDDRFEKLATLLHDSVDPEPTSAARSPSSSMARWSSTSGVAGPTQPRRFRGSGTLSPTSNTYGTSRHA